MTSDAGPAATIVTTEIKELRSACDRLDISWHHRNNEDTLRKKIDMSVNEEVTTVVNEAPEPAPVTKKKVRKFQPPEGIPADIKEALQYMNSYHQARANRVTEYIESLLNARTRT